MLNRAGELERGKPSIALIPQGTSACFTKFAIRLLIHGWLGNPGGELNIKIIEVGVQVRGHHTKTGQ